MATRLVVGINAVMSSQAVFSFSFSPSVLLRFSSLVSVILVFDGWVVG